jgi:hypothetical protein
MPPRRAVAVASAGVSGDGLLAWEERSGRRLVRGPRRGTLRFVFYGWVSTEGHQDPLTSGCGSVTRRMR